MSGCKIYVPNRSHAANLITDYFNFAVNLLNSTKLILSLVRCDDELVLRDKLVVYANCEETINSN